MSRTSSDDQLNFLIQCVKHSNNGKVDFEAVAKECHIVSKGAAAKRYERLMKANGINPNGGGSAAPDDGTPEKSAPNSKATPKKGPKTPAKVTKATKAKDGDTPKSASAKKRRSGKAADTSPAKKVKSEEKVVDSDSDKDNEKDGNVKEEDDPFITKDAVKTEGDDALFAQFCNVEADSNETA